MSYYIIGLLLSLMSWACSDDVETGREEIPVETDGGYLFAHMTNANYGKLYYAASRDGVNWETLNNNSSLKFEIKAKQFYAASQRVL